jgi:hypothetical protein
MAPTYVCPKCKGKDVYFANKQKITGIGGIYGNRQKEFKAPFCRKCDIEADLTPVGKNGKPLSGAELEAYRLKSAYKVAGCIAVVAVFLMMVIAVVAGMATW